MTPAQESICRMLMSPPNKVLVRASHAVGKTWLASALTSWFFDSYNQDSCVVTTAPTSRDVKDLLWAEIRKQRNAVGIGGSFVGKTAPEMRTGDDHYAKGFTAAKGESFQGRHPRYMMFVFDEAVGVEPIFWQTTKSMFRGGTGEHFWLAICNPTDTTSQAYQEEQSIQLDGTPAWKTVSMSAVEHPNIRAQLIGEQPPFPSAVTLHQLNDWVAEWCEPVAGDPDPSQDDFEWPPKSKRWYRPGPMFESRAMGRWPKQGTHSVWSDAAWASATKGIDWSPSTQELPIIGADLASFGDDETAFHVRWGNASMHHERHGGWDEGQTAGRLKQLCQYWAGEYNKLLQPNREPLDPKKIPVVYDASGRGGALGNPEYKADYNFIGVHAQGAARSSDYYNRRTELWFFSAKRAKRGELDLTRLDGPQQSRLRQELLAVRHRVAADGRAQVEDKPITKQRIKRSPDNADAMNLAYWHQPAWEPPSHMPGVKTPLTPDARRDVTPSRGPSLAQRMFGGNR
jgi:hypothetical protein